MNFVLFMALGTLEIMAMFAFMFKSFRFPYMEYVKEVAGIALIVSFISYLLRIYFEVIPVIDTIAHFVIYILFMWFVIRIKLWRAAIMSLFYIVYGMFTFVAYFAYVRTGLMTPEVVSQSNSNAAYVIQLTAIFISFFLAWLFHKISIGFSFFPRPPHDFILKRPLSKNDVIVLSGVLALAGIMFYSFLHITHNHGLDAIPINIVPIILVIFMAYRRDKKYERPYRGRSIPHRQNDEKMESRH